LLLGSRDRVALDAVGVAVLRIYGAKGHVAKGRVFDQEQIRRAAELGVGIRSAKDVRLVALNDECKDDVQKIGEVFAGESSEIA
jgi:uncharacterized protein (DUF362 family)